MARLPIALQPPLPKPLRSSRVIWAAWERMFRVPVVSCGRGTAAVVLGFLLAANARALDTNNDALDDVWVVIYNANGLNPAADLDGDGFSNTQESAGGTNPFDAASHPELRLATWSAAQVQLGYTRIAGKRYQIEGATSILSPTWSAELTQIATACGPGCISVRRIRRDEVLAAVD